MKGRILKRKITVLLSFIFFSSIVGKSQVTPNINSGDPNFPFPQFQSYIGGAQTLAHVNPIGVPHAEMEQRIIDAYTQVCNDMSYTIMDNGSWNSNVTVAGVRYIAPNENNSSSIGHCQCAEGDGYYLLAAAYMADKLTFDGYYMYIHDREFQNTTRFIDCAVNSPTYYGNPGLAGAGSPYNGNYSLTDVRGGGTYGGAALDGSEDIAMALLMAWKQWGDNGKICDDPCTGLPVTYKGEAIKYIKAMVEQVNKSWGTVVPGVIGLDGYRKAGDVTKEVTNWANGGAWMGLIPDNAGPATCGDCGGFYNTYADYAAPAYFKSFADMLVAEGAPSWYIDQYRRGEASDTWIFGQAYNQGLIPWSGLYKINEAGAGTTVTFGNMVEGEDFRYGWRTILNYLWNGNPTIKWDPATHNYTAGTNTYEHDMAIRFANFLKNPQAAPYNNPSETIGTMSFCGIPTALNQYSQDGTAAPPPSRVPPRYWPVNWVHGTGAPAAVVSQDFDLMAQMFRECVIKWDQGGTTQEYITSKPQYFHEWFRLLGMLVLTGNYPDPLDVDMNASISNMKVYKSVDKTYAYAGDTLTYTISYRNFAKASATNVVITDNLPAGLSVISVSNGGTVSGSTVTWNIGTVSGFVTGGLAATKGSVTLKVKVTSAASGRLCNTATIATSNGTGWTSNEYPNNITDVMQRNCVDILTQSPLALSKTGSRSTVMVGDTVSYTIVVKNQSVPFLNGGRPGVRITTGHTGISSSQTTLSLVYRIYHGAHEPLINYQNYRVSYFIKKAGPPVWTFTNTVNAGCTPTPTMSYQNLGATSNSNQRLILSFPSQLAVPFIHLDWYQGQGNYLHEGALYPQRVAYDIKSGITSFDWTTDYSSESAIQIPGGSTGPYYPIANDWTDPLNPNLPVTKYLPNNCSDNVTTTANKQLVEEWDGYTWRRIYGDGPASGRDLYNIVVRDTLPSEVTFGGYFTGYPTGTVSGNVITWPTVTSLAIGDSVVYKFWVTLKDATYFGCPSGPTPASFTNKAGATADKEPKALASATTNVSCTAVPVLSASMNKTADKSLYSVNDPITYTIKYTNLDGTVVQGNTTTADWTTFKGSSSISLNSATEINIAAPGWINTGWINKYSHGTNGTIMGTFSFPQNTQFYIVARYDGTNWVEVRFRIDVSDLKVSVYNMPAGTQIGTTQSTYYSAFPGAFDFELQFVNSSLNVWTVNSGTTISGSPTLSFSGLPVRAGYAGIRTDNGSTPSVLRNWYTHLDSDFNLQMTDPIPSGVSYVSATDATYNSVNYSGSNVSGTVTWQTIPGPILANEVITYVWKGKVTACTNNITNTAIAKIKGVSPDPSGQVIVGCNSTTPVTLLYFKGIPQNGNVLLEWTTTLEKNNSHFIVEKSLDGNLFEKIGLVQGKNNSQVPQDYFYNDEHVSSGKVYYRLRQVDKDNSESLSNIISLTLNGGNKVIVYPNPFTDETHVQIISNEDKKVSVRVKTIEGIIVYESNNHSTNEEILLGRELSDAVYILQIISDDETVNYKLIKNK